MKIAISANGPTLDAEVDPRFGRCPYFIIADPDTMEFEAIDNASAMASGGAGISAAQMVAGKGVAAIITGNCGPNAHQVLAAANIEMITGASDKVKDVIESYRDGKLKASSQPNVPDHFGMGGGGGGGTGGGGMGGGMGQGMGRGMGRRCGRGGGRGMGGGMGQGRGGGRGKGGLI
ncbi:MAG: NifB/NifX family molybdenum-iron cluster-binding protein [Dehalococcoidia bacterium]|jgi:predicted Fe-Mo cluster-binding NifX family protein